VLVKRWLGAVLALVACRDPAPTSSDEATGSSDETTGGSSSSTADASVSTGAIDGSN
jgi:hypothetical protein